jgi:hypothetical protein
MISLTWKLHLGNSKSDDNIERKSLKVLKTESYSFIFMLKYIYYSIETSLCRQFPVNGASGMFSL